MFNLKRFLTENRLTEASRLDEAVTGPRDPAANKIWHQVAEALTSLQRTTTLEERSRMKTRIYLKRALDELETQ